MSGPIRRCYLDGNDRPGSEIRRRGVNPPGAIRAGHRGPALKDRSPRVGDLHFHARDFEVVARPDANRFAVLPVETDEGNLIRQITGDVSTRVRRRLFQWRSYG